MTDVRAKFEAVPLPLGYTLEWDGEYNSQLESTEALLPGFGLAFGTVLTMLVVPVLYAMFYKVEPD